MITKLTPPMADVVESGIDAAAEAFKRMHGNVCYPSASDGEAKWAAEEIVKAYLGSARLSQAGAAVWLSRPTWSTRLGPRRRPAA